MERITVIETLYGAYYTISTVNDVFTIILKQEALGQDEVRLMCCDFDVINNSIFEFKNHRVTTIKINEIGYIGIKYIEDGYVLNRIEYNINRIRREKEKKINKIRVRDFLATENNVGEIEIHKFENDIYEYYDSYTSEEHLECVVKFGGYTVKKIEIDTEWSGDEYHVYNWYVIRLYIARD